MNDSSKTTKKKRTDRINLHEVLAKKSFNHAVITTYSFDPTFFEEYCLVKFNSLSNNGNITVITDKGTYEKAILGPEGYRPKQANLRYLFHPVSVSGVFHPKIFMLVSKNKGRLLLGSANFPRPGITSNAELVGCYDFEEENSEDFKYLFQGAFDFLVEVARRWHGEALDSNLQAISREANWLVDKKSIPADQEIGFIHNISVPLWRQIISEIEGPVDRISVLSRYFDAEPDILDRLYNDLKPSKIVIYTQNGINTLNYKWVKHHLVSGGNVDILLCQYKDEEFPQNLHAKAIAIEAGDKCVFAYGSANFTTPAMLQNADKGNVEAMLLFRHFSRKDIKPERLFDPYKTAVRLQSEGMLVFEPREEEQYGQNHRIRLLEVVLVEERIWFRAEIPEDIDYEKIRVQLTFHNEARRSLSAMHSHDNKYDCEISCCPHNVVSCSNWGRLKVLS